MRENVAVVITGTSFASVRHEDAGLGSPIWEHLNRPVLQLLSSSRPRANWQNSSRGLDPLDLSLQVVMPELDGRITTRPCAFRDLQADPHGLATAIPSLIPEPDGISWLIEHARRWVALQQTPTDQRRISLVLANYPVRMDGWPMAWDWTPPPVVSPSSIGCRPMVSTSATIPYRTAVML